MRSLHGGYTRWPVRQSIGMNLPRRRPERWICPRWGRVSGPVADGNCRSVACHKSGFARRLGDEQARVVAAHCFQDGLQGDGQAQGGDRGGAVAGCAHESTGRSDEPGQPRQVCIWFMQNEFEDLLPVHAVAADAVDVRPQNATLVDVFDPVGGDDQFRASSDQPGNADVHAENRARHNDSTENTQYERGVLDGQQDTYQGHGRDDGKQKRAPFGCVVPGGGWVIDVHER